MRGGSTIKDGQLPAQEQLEEAKAAEREIQLDEDFPELSPDNNQSGR